SALTSRLQSEPRGGAPELRVANRLWPGKGLELLADFSKLMADKYGAPIESVDFGDLEGSRKKINAWAAEQTRQKIQELIPKNQLHPDSLLVLTNAIYFKGRWQVPFKSEFTRPQPFYVDGG